MQFDFKIKSIVLDLYLASETCATRFDFFHVKFTKYGNDIENIERLYLLPNTFFELFVNTNTLADIFVTYGNINLNDVFLSCTNATTCYLIVDMRYERPEISGYNSERWF